LEQLLGYRLLLRAPQPSPMRKPCCCALGQWLPLPLVPPARRPAGRLPPPGRSHPSAQKVYRATTRPQHLSDSHPEGSEGAFGRRLDLSPSCSQSLHKAASSLPVHPHNSGQTLPIEPTTVGLSQDDA